MSQENDAVAAAVVSRPSKIRGGHKASLKKLYSEVDACLRGFNLEMKPSLLALRGSLERKAEIITKLDGEVMAEIEDDEKILEEIDASDQVQLQIRTKIMEIDTLMRRVDEAHPDVKPDVGTSSFKTMKAKMKLPKLEIMKFGGNPKEYMAFKDAFSVAIGDNSTLSDVEKFTYLRSFLTGEAAGAIKGLAATDANYKEALAILEERFGNKQVIVNSHMDALIKLSQVTDVDNTKGIRKLYDEIETNLRSLKSLGVKTDSFGCLLVPILLSKLPSSLNLHLSRKFDTNTDVWKIDLIMEELRKELEARERCQSVAEKNTSRFSRRDYSTAEVLYARENYTPSCAYCDGQHFSDRCRRVTDVKKRKELLRRKRKCFLCTRGHMMKDCTTKKKCFQCKGDHHTSICEKYVEKREDEDKKEEGKETLSNAAFSARNAIMLQTMHLEVQATRMADERKKGVVFKVLLDSGSQRTYITKKAAEAVGATIHHKEKLTIGGFGGATMKEKLYNIVDVLLSKRDCEANVKVQGIVVEKICSPQKGNCIKQCIELFPHLVGLPLAIEDSGEEIQDVHMLVGIDHYYDIITGETIRGEAGPIAVASKFGYVLAGKMKDVPGRGSKSLHTQVLTIENVTNEEIYSEVKKFWEVESIGVKDEEEVENFDVKIERRADRYYVNMPWKKDHPVLCDNFEMSRRRLMNNLSRMKKNTELMQRYCKIMNTQEEAGIIEEVSENEEAVVGKTYYMPHHAVVREDKLTTKTRIVYDASSKCEGASLNECLYSGNTVFTDLLGTILRFRCYRVGVIADIQQAFLSVGVKEEDRNALRFLWVKDPDSESTEIRVMRFTRVCFGVVSSMAHLDLTIRHHLKLFEVKYADTVERIRISLYVDDLTTGHNSTEEVWKLYKETKYIFSQAEMNIRKWRTNDKDLDEKIQRCENPDQNESEEEDGESFANETLNPEEKAPTKVLGTPWNTDDDTLLFTLDVLKAYDPGRITKRVLLRAIASVFDPLGFLSPIVVTLKMLFQEVCKVSNDWDEVLNPVHQQRWNEFLDDLRDFKGLQIPRFFGNKAEATLTLVGFGDASENAYAACIYLVKEDEGGVRSSLVVSKTRVAPLKTQTMPRLELLASLILSRLMIRTKDELEKVMKIGRVICCTDAEIVLNWIRGEEKTFKQFVENRVSEIRRNVPIDAWYHVPGIENIADLPSRGCSPKRMLLNGIGDKWLLGPSWLLKNFEEWPIKKDIKHQYEDVELKKESGILKKSECLFSCETSKPALQKIMQLERFGSFDKLIRVTAWCRRFIGNCRRKADERKLDELDAEECQLAEGLWIRSVQAEMMCESAYEKRSKSLGVFEDDKEFLRCKGRIGKAKIKFGTRFPLLIPTNNYLTNLIIKSAHDKVYHNGVKETLAEVRSIYWLVKGRQAVKRTIRKCCLCKLLEGLAYPPPITCDLPDFRVNPGKAFETAGVDMCGPVYIKEMYKKNGEMNKAYIVITTCSTSRMVHLELIPDLSTSAYLRGQRRFMARRGFPEMMVSDNGRTFKGRELSKYNASHGIRWRFNLPKAPWWGGMFERMVRSTKRCLKKAVRNRKLTYEELLTILTEVEAVINNRPLTYLDEADLEQVLTPSHLFCGRRTLDPSTGSDAAEISNLNGRDAIRRMRLVNSIIDHFWKRWSKEYLIELRENHKMNMKQKKLDIKVGDVVLVHQDGVKRNKWKMGRIEEVIIGEDGVIRGASVRTACNDKIGNIRRPLQKLYPMELGSRCSEEAQDASEDIIVAEKDVTEDASEDIVAEKDVTEDASEDIVAGKDVTEEQRSCNSLKPVADKDAEQEEESNKYEVEPCSGSLGSSGGASGGGTVKTFDDKLERLLDTETTMKSKRKAAIDGQLRRRINDLSTNSN